MTVTLSSEEIANAISEYAIRKLGGAGSYKAEVQLQCEPNDHVPPGGPRGGTFSASVTFERKDNEPK